MRTEKITLCGWLSKALLLVALLLFSGGQTYAANSIINSTRNIAEDNVRKVKNSAQDLLEELEGLGDDIENMGKTASDMLQEGGSTWENAMDVLKGSLQDIKKLDVSALKNFDLDNIKQNIDNLKNSISEETEAGKNLKTRVSNIESKAATLINNVKNVINFAYTMPVGICSDNLKFDISVDTLSYGRDGEESGYVALDAQAHWTLPFTMSGDPVELGFRGEHIVIMGDGDSKIFIDPSSGFVEKDFISYTLSKDKVYLDLKKTSYVQFDCNGFKEMYLEGQVRFSSKVITNAKAEKNGDSSMVAEFEIYVKDLSDFFFEAQFKDPFKVKATEDVIYTAYGIVADFSTTRNATNFQFPQGYKSPFQKGDEAYWTGFAMKTLKVDLSKQFPEFPLDSIAAYNMLIDETGVSGWFEASLTTQGMKGNSSNGNQKKENKKNSTIDAQFKNISLGLSGGKISGGGVTGIVRINPLVDDKKDTLTLSIGGKMYSDNNGHLNFDIKTEIEKDMVYRLPIVDTTKVTLGQGTYFQFQHVTDTTTNEKKFNNVFTLVVNGGIDVNNPLVKIRDLKFEGLKLCSAKPHFDAGKFSLNSVDMPSLHGLPFGLKSLGAKTSTKNEAMLQPKIYLSLIGKESADDKKQGASVEAGFDLVATIKDEGEDTGWKLTGLRLNSIKVDINYSAFHLKGEVNGYKDDPIRGDGFGGGVDFSMKTPKINASIKAEFGRTKFDYATKGQLENEYKYWYVFGSCEVPPGIVLFPTVVYLKSVSISAYSKVRPLFDRKKFEVTQVTPDNTTKFGFTAGIGFYAAQQSLIDAKVQMGMDFSSSGGIRRIGLDGLVGIVGKGEGGDFNNSFMVGGVNCNYDFENEIFSADIWAEAGPAINDIVEGSATLKLRTYPNSWYCNLGTVYDPVRLKFVKKINATTYMMFGDSVPTVLPPLDPRISALFEVTQSTATSSDHSDMLSNGTGFAFGVALSLDCHLDKFVYADLEFMGGTDLLIVRRNEEMCGSSKYRAKGQVYVYVNAGAGIKVRKKKFEIVEFEAAADLMGEVPKPVYIEGNIAFRYRVLGGLISGHAHAKYSHGTECRPGATEPGPFHDSELYGVEEDSKAQDENGNEVNWNE